MASYREENDMNDSGGLPYPVGIDDVQADNTEVRIQKCLKDFKNFYPGLAGDDHFEQLREKYGNNAYEQAKLLYEQFEEKKENDKFECKEELINSIGFGDFEKIILKYDTDIFQASLKKAVTSSLYENKIKGLINHILNANNLVQLNYIFKDYESYEIEAALNHIKEQLLKEKRQVDHSVKNIAEKRLSKIKEAEW